MIYSDSRWFPTKKGWESRESRDRPIRRAYERFCNLKLPIKKYTSENEPMIYTKFNDFPCLFIEYDGAEKSSLFKVEMKRLQISRFRKYIIERMCQYDGITYKMIYFPGVSICYLIVEV